MTTTRCGFIVTGNHHSKTLSLSPVQANIATSAVIATAKITETVVVRAFKTSKAPVCDAVLDKTSSPEASRSGFCSTSISTHTSSSSFHKAIWPKTYLSPDRLHHPKKHKRRKHPNNLPLNPILALFPNTTRPQSPVSHNQTHQPRPKLKSPRPPLHNRTHDSAKRALPNHLANGSLHLPVRRRGRLPRPLLDEMEAEPEGVESDGILEDGLCVVFDGLMLF
ncbi:hypothetical protein TARUN_3011 [Trichoderma arundinaceum]|uniref:Uncharacterized protein n=1 Tax=Trichoderma arundinaceum TaxID=490622 RepID=A0A395NTD6_TRIAR|nr:hypothetical protein TARUN_3011 [Trichoderma arundinaceum]